MFSVVESPYSSFSRAGSFLISYLKSGFGVATGASNGTVTGAAAGFTMTYYGA
jgi:hypothetical protein